MLVEIVNTHYDKSNDSDLQSLSIIMEIRVRRITRHLQCMITTYMQ